MQRLKENIFEGGKLEIMSFLPASLLKDVDLDEMDIATFLQYLAKARYLEEIRQIMHANGILMAFSDGD